MNDFRVIIAARNFYKYTTLKEGADYRDGSFDPLSYKPYVLRVSRGLSP
jgi:hypothetical protein